MKGLNKDFNIINQPEGSYPFALNATATTVEAKYANLSFEPSNILTLTLPIDYTVWGTIFINDSTIIFSGNGINSEIGEFKNNVYTTIINDEAEACKLSFSSIIKGKEFRIKSGCNRTIYWSDNVNPDRYLDLDNLDSIRTNGQLDCNKLIFNRETRIPQIELTVNNQGGILNSGSYAFVIEYLDDNQNIIYKSIPTRFIPIYNDSLNNNYDDIHGNVNFPQFDPVQGGVPQTNKSIELLISNVDETASFVRINVIESTTSSGEVRTAHTLGNLIPVTEDTINFIYSGFNPDNGDTFIAYDTLVTRLVKYNTSRAMEQIDNRLLRANVSEINRDYSQYQRVANRIKTIPTRRSQRAKNINAQHNSKNPKSYINGMTFQGDEIYAFGIVFIHDDGTESPSFHIPGRAKVDDDQIIIPYNASNPDLKHLPQKDQYETWEVYNTGVHNDLIRRMGYYETDTVYPEITSCSGQLIYGELTGQPIRHHRFPCRTQSPLQFEGEQTNLNYLGIIFSDIEYPDPTIVAHRFTYVKRTRFNKTVLDSGYITGVGKPPETENASPNELQFKAGDFWQTTNLFLAPEDRYSKEVVQFISPKTLGGLYTGGTYLKFNFGTLNLITDTFGTTHEKTGDGQFQMFHTNYELAQQFPVTETYRSYNDNIFIGRNSTQTGFNNFVVNNRSLSNNGNVILLEDELSTIEVADIYPTIDVRNIYTYNKQYIKPYSNLEALQYSILSPPLYNTNNYTSYDGDTFINELNVLSIGSYTIISDDTQVFGNTYQSIYVESDINFDLRVAGTNCNTIWNNNVQLGTQYMLSKVATGSGNDYVAREGNTVCPEFYFYNRDYDVLSSYSVISLPNNYNYCNRCLTKKPNRIIFSPKSFNEEYSDYYLYNYVNDYVDLPLERGEIVGMKYKNGKLYVHCTDTTFVLQPNPQAINTSGTTAYITTGEFLGIPPQELMTTDLGFGGMQYELANINTEFGYFWVDQKRGQIYRLSDSLDTISNKGLSAWFRENLKNDTEVQYDPYFQRVMFSHKNSATTNCDEAFTLSFFPHYDAFISYHSYIPNQMFSTHNTFYTINGNKIYEHRKEDEFLEFYNQSHPFVIEEVKNDFSTDNLDFITYYAEFFNQTTKVKEAYNKVVVYNDNQSTGLLDLILIDHHTNPYGNIQLQPNQRSVVITDHNSKISNLYDLSTANTIVRRRCTEQPYSDVVFTNTDSSKSAYTNSLFKDKFIKVRLYYYPTTNRIKGIHYITQPIEQPSIR